MRLGAPITERITDPAELARAHVALGYRAGFCPFGLSLDDTAYLDELRRAFGEHDVVIAEVIAWRNLNPRDDTMRAAAFDKVAEQLAVADEVGARCCVTFGGTHDNVTGWTPHPENLSPASFEVIVDIARRLIDQVKPRRTKLVLEMMASVFPDSADSYLSLIEAIDRPAFAVHFDPVNLIFTREHYFDTGAVIRECVEKLGPWIASCHAKDIRWLPGRGFLFAEGVPGTGVLDFRTYLSEVRRLDPDLPVLVEHLDTTEEYQQGFEYLRAIEADLSR